MPRKPEDISDATLRLLLAKGIGPVTWTRSLAYFGNADTAVAAPESHWRELEGIGATHAQQIVSSIGEVDVEGERWAMSERGATLIMRGDEDYPPLLAAIDDPPSALWVLGEMQTADRLSVAIVGSRKCTPYGREQAGRFAALLAQCGLTIVSGGALGIDGEAHRAALRVNGRTIVVLAGGLSRCYPPEHADLFDRVAAGGGAVVTESPMNTEPRAKLFPKRNRIISGLSLGVLVVEAAMRSGALITARMAQEQGREVMCLPGRVDSPASAGSLRVLRDGWAAMVLDHADVLSQLDAASQLVRGALEAAGHPDAASRATLFDTALTEAQRKIVAALEAEQGQAMLVDQLAAATGLPMGQLMAELTLLQVRGKVSRDDRGVRSRVDRQPMA